MVSRKTRRRQTMKMKKQKQHNLLVILMMVFSVGMAICVGFLVRKSLPSMYQNNSPSNENVQEASSEPEPEPVEPDTPKAKPITFQPMIDNWVSRIGGEKSVLIYDVENEENVGEYNLNRNYSIASLYKLFVVYEGYKRVQNGVWAGDAAAGSTGYTISKCLDLAIRESNSACAETLWQMIGRDEMERIISSEYMIVDSDINHLVSNVGDVADMMKIYYAHPDITDETLLSQMWGSFLNQPITTYNWRQALPSGFSKANVYDKVGWDFNPDGGYWNIYNETAIVEFPEEDRHFIVVVMTERVPFERIRELGTSIEQTYYDNLNSTE